METTSTVCSKSCERHISGTDFTLASMMRTLAPQAAAAVTDETRNHQQRLQLTADSLHPVETLAAHNLREKPGRPYAQECANGKRPDQHPDSEISSANKTTTEAVSDREIKDDEIERA